jgi:hypothetical protein
MRMERFIDAERLRPDSAALVLAEVVLPQVSRALSLIDLNSQSPTFGCADRAYWYYRTLTNFPGATWQQLMLALACVYRTSHSSNAYYLDPTTASLVGGLISFWAKSQHSDGAFDEWYLNEHSYCPTAITSAGAALTLHLMGDDLPRDARIAGLTALERAGKWLEPRYNAEVMNQNLAACVALQGLAKLLPASGWDAVARAKLERVRNDQNAEGWFPEYGGFDFGYSTLALDLLGACRLLDAGSIVDDLAGKLCRMLVDVRGAGPAAPGRLGSRGTSHAFAFGALVFAVVDTNAALLAQHQLDGIARRVVPRPDTVDDRYFAYFALPQFALAYLYSLTDAGSIAPAPAPSGMTDKRASGLAVVRHTGWSITLNRRLGGALALEMPDRSPLYHLGYEATTQQGGRFSTATLAEDRLDPCVESTPFEIAARFRAVSSGLPLRRWMVPFQAVLYMLRSSRAAAAFQGTIKRRMISPRRSLPLRLVRIVDVSAESVRVTDTLIPQPGLAKVVQIQVASTVAMHTPSGRQDDGMSQVLAPDDALRVVDLLNAGTTASIAFTLDPQQRRKETLDVDIQRGNRRA